LRRKAIEEQNKQFFTNANGGIELGKIPSTRSEKKSNYGSTRSKAGGNALIDETEVRYIRDSLG
jgi:hypothetical protein